MRGRGRGRYLDIKYVNSISAAFFVVFNLRQLLLPDIAIAAIRIWFRRVGGLIFNRKKKIKKTLVLKNFTVGARIIS